MFIFKINIVFTKLTLAERKISLLKITIDIFHIGTRYKLDFSIRINLGASAVINNFVMVKVISKN